MSRGISMILPLFLTIRLSYFFFFFQAEDGIRDLTVTGVQTCALPIYRAGRGVYDVREQRDACGADRYPAHRGPPGQHPVSVNGQARTGAGPRAQLAEIGRASCRERV